MRKSFMLKVGAVVASAFVIWLLASAMGRKPPMTSIARGKVTVVNVKDAKRPTVTVKPTQGQAVTLQIDPKKTLIMKNDKVVAASDIRIGDILKADYEIKRGNNLAKLLFVQMPQASKPAAKPASGPVKKATQGR